MTRFELLKENIRNKNTGKSFLLTFYLIFAVGMGVFHLYTSAFGVLESWQQKGVHLGFVLVIAFLLPLIKRDSWAGIKGKLGAAGTIVLLVLSLAFFAYVRLSYPQILYRLGMPNQTDIIMFWVLTVLLLVSAKIYLGWPLPILTIIFMIYAMYGEHLSGPLKHTGFSMTKITDQLFLSGSGIFGPALGASAVFIVIFIIFGNFLIQTTVGDFFVVFATALAGRYRGGPAKTAVIASALMGTIHGSGPGNVATTGTFTIPLMKRLGYQPHFAGAVEASASTGGIIMPPIMGATAFIMAEMARIPYSRIVLAAVIPACLYFMAVFTMVHLEAIKDNLKPIPKEELPDFKKVMLSDGYLLLPILAIIIFLIMGYSPMKAGFYGILVTVVLSMFKKRTRLNLVRLIAAIEGGAREIVTIAVACATAGIVAGLISLTGLGVKLSYVISAIANGNMLIALVMTMVVCIILGMGMPVTAAFILVAATTTTILTNMGIPLLAASMFMFYYATVSAITPPVALSSYAGAGIAGADQNKTALTAVKLALSAFIVPFMFVYGNELLWEGAPLAVFQAAVTALAGVVCLSVSVHGWHFNGPCLALTRVLLGAAALLMIESRWYTDVIGVACILAAYAIERFIHKNKNSARKKIYPTS